MADTLFGDFDFKILNDKNYKEDAVREDIVSPILKKLGYSASGENKMLRTIPLTHPFVYIGTQKRVINIIPDYLLQVKKQNVLILDAKAPNENILKSKNVEQAFSYAIHRDVRTFHYALCNGKEITVFQISKYEPILHIPIQDIDNRWDELYKAISPIALTKPHILNFNPDFGVSMLKFGASPDMNFHFVGAWVNNIAKISDDLYSIFSVISFDKDKFAASFDFPKTKFDEFFNCVPDRIKQKVRRGLTQQPYRVDFDETDAFELIISSHFSEFVHKGQNEDYLPLIVDKFEPLPDVRQIFNDIMKE
ncbi:MAG: hypothetical protein ACXVPU_08650 [Bacteroidia bacterium]